MESVAKVIVKKRKIFDSQNCFLCGSSNPEGLVLQPSTSSYSVLSESLEKLVRWNYEDALQVSKIVGGSLTVEHLQAIDAHWHTSCYKRFTHKKSMDQKEKKFLQAQEQPLHPELNPNLDTDDSARASSSHFTRSNTPVYQKSHCFFCDLEGKVNNQLRHVSFDSSGDSLRRAVEISGNDVWRVRLSESVSPGDAHAIDVLYHVKCWALNVTNVLRKQAYIGKTCQKNVASIASDMEFLRVIDDFLTEGNVSCMADLHTTYLNICSSNGLDPNVNRVRSRKELKQFMVEEIPGIIFSAAKKKNLSERISLAPTRDAAMWKLEEESNEHQMNILFQAALVLRDICQSSEKWNFKGSLDDESFKVPDKLLLFFKWCLVGKSNITGNIQRRNEVDDRSHRLSQILMFECLSTRQATYTTGDTIRRNRELPLQVGVGLTLHRDTRSAKLVDFFSRLGISVNYHRVRTIENEIARSVIKRMEATDGVFVPPELKPGIFTHFATDNLDFHEDTPDGKRTLHATVLVAYQSLEEGDTVEDLVLYESEEPTKIPESIYRILPCTIGKNVKPVYTQLLPHCVTELISKDLLKEAILSDLSWLFGKGIFMKNCEKEIATSEHGLTWAAHNSCILPTNTRKTVVAVFPILDTSPTDRSVQLTVIRQFQKVKELLQGPGKRTVITIDLGLYRPMQQLQMALQEKNSILLPGDLHVVMAQLRAIGSFIELTGIPKLWLESGIYSDQVSKRILEGKPVRRSIEAHMVTLQVLFSLFCEEFFKHYPDEQLQCEVLAQKLAASWTKSDGTSIKQAHLELEEKLRNLEIALKMDDYSREMCSTRPTFALAIQYMNMVFSMLAFIRSVRSSNWELRLATLHDFAKYFFALDLRNYAAMSALHLAEMVSLKAEDPETWSYLQSGLWAPNKSGNAFCSLGADEALEQENKKMKVMGGLVGITLQPQTLTKFFLVAPYTAKISLQVHAATRVQSKEKVHQHHQLGQSAASRQLRYANSLINSFRNFTVPFQNEGQDLVNLVTNRVYSDTIRNDVCRMSSVGAKQHEEFVQKRIVDKSVNFWEPMPNLKLQLCKSAAKKITAKIKVGIIEIKEDLNLFTRCLLICRSRSHMNLKDIIGKYELTVVPRSLFYNDGSMIHSDGKSKLMHHLEDLVEVDTTCSPSALSDKDHSKAIVGTVFDVAIVDAMVEVQTLDVRHAQTIAELSSQFSERMLKKYGAFSELHVVFDTYIQESLKATERTRRQRGIEAVRYKIEGNAKIKGVLIKKLLSHIDTKDEITEFFSKDIIRVAKKNCKNVIVSFRTEAISTFLNAEDLQSTHEESDTKLLLHAIHAANRGANRIRIFSSDTDVLVLAVRRAPLLPYDTIFVTMGVNKREIHVRKIFDALGSQRAAALPGLHALSGADITGSFSGKAKTSFWNRFIDAPDTVLSALASLGKSDIIPEETFAALESFVCSVYLRPNAHTNFEKLADLRWWFYSKKQAQGQSMPPTSSSLRPAILRCHFQCMEWYRDFTPHPNLPSPSNYGWVLENGKYEPVMCDLNCAPDEVMDLIKCSCKKGRCAPPCKCASQNPPLPCTEMCGCGADDQWCDNSVPSQQTNGEAVSSDEENFDSGVDVMF